MTGKVKANLWKEFGEVSKVHNPTAGHLVCKNGVPSIRKPYDIGNRIPSDPFGYDKEQKLFIGELSTIGPMVHITDALYNDACDRGFVMVSQWTGKEVTFALQNTVVENEELVAWFFTSDAGFTCKIFND